MDPRLLRYYNRELQHIREMGGEFAQEYPKIAGRLGLDGFECADPYVERLLEGFAFMAARVQLKVDAQFPRFTHHLLEMVYPHYLAPTPSMLVAQFQPDPNESGLADGYDIVRDTAIRSLLGRGERTACEYRTAHDLKLWPIEISEAEYLPTTGSVAAAGISDVRGAKAAIRIKLKTTAGLKFNEIALDTLQLFVRGADEFPMRIYEQFFAQSIGVILRPGIRPVPWQRYVDAACIHPLGFDDEQALLPHTHRSFQGYRLLHEYFAFPQRYLFVQFAGLQDAIRRCEQDQFELIVLLKQPSEGMEELLDADNFALHCTPAINLFPKKADRIHLNPHEHEYHAVPDRTRPMDFEIHSMTAAIGTGTSNESMQDFLPFYSSHDLMNPSRDKAYYTISREQRMLSTKQRRQGPRSTYIGSETYVGLVDGNEAPFNHKLKQLVIDCLMTNRDLPLHMPIGRGHTDFTMQAGAPTVAIRAVAGPTKPRPSIAERETTWQLVSHLSLNYLSLIDTDEHQGASAMRSLLKLYSDFSDASVRKQVEGVRSVTSKGITRRLPTPGPVTFGRGLEIKVECDEASFEGTGVFLLGAVLDQFFRKYASINSFTETVISSTDRGTIMRWPARLGLKPSL